MSVFVTVGSTGFDDLIQKTTGYEFLETVSSLNIKRIVFQYGSSESIFLKNIQAYKGSKLQIEGYKYKPSTTEEIQAADIVISHAGSGTILQVLRLQNKKLIVVVNSLLLGNHQLELAEAIDSKRYAICSEISNLIHAVQNIQKFSIQAFPGAKNNKFASILDKHMGF